MINKELLEYIKKRLSENVTKEDLVTELASGGWNKNDVEESIKKIESNNIIENNEVIIETDKRPFYLNIVILLFHICLISLIWNWNSFDTLISISLIVSVFWGISFILIIAIKKQKKWVNIFRWLLLLLAAITTLLTIYSQDMGLCSGLGCMLFFVLFWVIVPSSIWINIIYYISYYALKWNLKVIKSLMYFFIIILPLLLVASFIFRS